MEFQKNIPTIEKYGLKIAIENHCDLFADEVVWMVKNSTIPRSEPAATRSTLSSSAKALLNAIRNGALLLLRPLLRQQNLC